MSKTDKLSTDLDDITSALEIDELSDEEKQFILDGAIEDFNNIEGIKFADTSKMTAENRISKEFDISKKVLQKNIDRTEKLTSIIFGNIALDNQDVIMISTGVSILSAQNQNLKLLSELQNKAILNLQAQKRLELADKPKDEKKNELPPGFSAQ